jgi:Rrf2 family protein
MGVRVLSQTGEYAVRALLFIAAHGDGKTVRADEIATALRIPPSYLSKTLQTLARVGVLTSERGRHGGFRLAVPADELLLDAVVAPFEEKPARRHCLLGGKTCSDSTACAAHHAWKGTAEHIAVFFRTTTLAALVSGA